MAIFSTDRPSALARLARDRLNLEAELKSIRAALAQAQADIDGLMETNNALRRQIASREAA
jgi:hypothetical protein